MWMKKKKQPKVSKSQTVTSMQESRPTRKSGLTFGRFFNEPPELDIRGLGRKVCEILGVRSGDSVEFHLLADGSVRIINCGNR